MSDPQAEFLRRLNIESFRRQLAGPLTDAQRAVVLLLLAEAEAEAGKARQNTPFSRVSISDDDAVMYATGTILSEWDSSVRTAQQARAALREIHAGRKFGPPSPQLGASLPSNGQG